MPEKKTDSEVYTTPVGTMYIEDGLFYSIYHEKPATLEDTRQYVQQIKDTFPDHLPIVGITDLRARKKSNKEARNYLVSDAAAPYIKAAALITNSGLSRMVGNLFLSFSKPPYHIRIFSNMEKAKAWLQQYL